MISIKRKKAPPWDRDQQCASRRNRKCNSHAPAIPAPAREKKADKTAPRPEIAGAQLITPSVNRNSQYKKSPH